MFYRALSLPHRICLFQDILLLPAIDAALFAGRIFSFQGTRSTVTASVRTQLPAFVLSREPVRQPRFGRTDVFVLFGNLNRTSPCALPLATLA